VLGGDDPILTEDHCEGHAKQGFDAYCFCITSAPLLRTLTLIVEFSQYFFTFRMTAPQRHIQTLLYLSKRGR
jgi:hypothetical protein